jgi:DNA ligase 1
MVPMLFSEVAEYYDKLESVSSRLKMIEIMGEMLKGASASEIDKLIYITQGILAPPFEGVEFGVAEKIVEESIAVATGYSKDEVDREYKKSGDMGLAAKSVVERSKMKKMISRKHTVSEIYDSMRKVAAASGAGSKDVKIRMLAEMITFSTPSEAKYVARYPIGQLRLGAGDSTIIEALSVMATGERKLKPEIEGAYNICSDLGLVGKELKSSGADAVKRFKVTLFKPVRPALAERLPTAEEIIEKAEGKAVAVEQKYDGFRCQIHKDGKKVKVYSRKLEETTAMFPDIVKAAQEEVKADKIIFEGEALAYNEATEEFLPFQETIQRKRKHGIAAKALSMPLHLFAFDLLYINGKDYMKEPYERRREELESVLSGSKIITPSYRIVTDSPKKLDSFFQSSVEEGLEGVIVKDMAAPYIAGARKFSWIKMKRSYEGKLSDTLDLAIVGYYLGRGSRAEFQFGGLLCAAYNKKNDTFETVSRLGSGFTEKQMQDFKKLLDKIKMKEKPARVDAIVKPDFWVQPKYVVTVTADEITRSPTHTCGREKQPDGSESGYALRFPRLVGEETVRMDKGADDATTVDEVKEIFSMQKRVGVREES